MGNRQDQQRQAPYGMCLQESSASALPDMMQRGCIYQRLICSTSTDTVGLGKATSPGSAHCQFHCQHRTHAQAAVLHTISALCFITPILQHATAHLAAKRLATRNTRDCKPPFIDVVTSGCCCAAQSLIVLAGCGVVTFTCHESAAAALEALHGKYMWPDSEAPMVVEWMDPSRLAATQQRSFPAGKVLCSGSYC
jgi:hypothetical protein